MPGGSAYDATEYVALAHAAGEVWAMVQMRAEKKNATMENSYKLHHRRIRALKGLSGLPTHDRSGASLCIEFAKLKRELVNVWRPIWNSLLVGKILPSGKALDEMKITFKKALYNKLQLGAVEEKERGHELLKKARRRAHPFRVHGRRWCRGF